MSGITDPSEEYFKDGLWAWVANQWKKLVADASSFLQINIAAQDIDVEVKQTTASDLTPGIMGWDGTQWRKLPMVWGYSDRYAEVVSNLTAAAGTNVLAGTAVPAGEVWVIQSVAVTDANNAPSRVWVYVLSGSVRGTLLDDNAAVANIFSIWTGNIALKEDDKIQASLYGCVAGDDLHCYIWGYKVKIAQ